MGPGALAGGADGDGGGAVVTAVDLLLGTVDGGASPAPRPRIGWLSARRRPAVVAIARRLDLDVEVVDEREALERGRPWDVVTADASTVPVAPLRLTELARRTGARYPNAAAVGLAADPAAARAALAAAGFPVTGEGEPDGRWSTVAVARRPSGWWRLVESAGTAPADPLALELTVSAAAGLDVAGVLAVEVVTMGDQAFVDAVRVGPHPDDPRAVEAHLRGLLDLPLEVDPAGLPR